MAFLNDDLLDLALQEIEDSASQLNICNAEPATYAAATTTYFLGDATILTYTGPVGGDTSGRKTTIDAITDGSVLTTGTALAWGLTDGSTTLYAAGSLTTSQLETAGNVFTLTAFDIEIPDAV